MPATTVLLATVMGPYDKIGAACDELADHIATEGLQPTGKMFNRHLVGPGRTSNPAEYATEVCIPLG